MRQGGFQRPQQRPPQQPDVEILVPGARGRRAFSGGQDEEGPLVLGNKQAVESKLRAGRTSGSYNLACLSLTAVPPAAVNPWDAAHLRAEDSKAWEVAEPVKVDASMNELAGLPADMSVWAPSLRALLVRQNCITELPRALFSLTALTTLDLSSNRLTSFGGGNDPALLQGLPMLRELNLKNNELVELPASFGALAALETLDVSCNKLASLPNSFSPRLVSLVAHQNAIAALPHALLSLPSLRILDLRKNRLQERDGRPLDLSRLRSVTHVDLRENQLSFAPTPLPLNVISQFYLGNNRIRRLPPNAATWFAALAVSLTELDLQGNGLDELPIEVGFAQKLKLLDVQNNELRDIPFTLGYLPDLNRVSIEGNPLRTVRRSLFSAPVSELKKYLRTRGDPPAWLLALEDGKDAAALAAELDGPPTPAGARIAAEEQQQPQLQQPLGPPLPSVSAFASPAFLPFATPPLAPPAPALQQPPAAPTKAAAPLPPSCSFGDNPPAPAPAPAPPAGQDGSAAQQQEQQQQQQQQQQAALLDREIARLEAELEGLGLTKQREALLKKELALKRAERARRRASLG